MKEIKPGVFMQDELIDEVIEAAISARVMAYAPYSNFKVGAALLTKQGTVYSGCNIENAAYSAANCAERTAFFKAISYGEKEFSCIAIVGGKADAEELDYCAPCGVCRQVMEEFCVPKDFYIFMARSKEDYKVYSLEELLPEGFGPNNLI